MCIIISKYKGVKLPKKQTLENCFYNNNDGAGFAYTHNGKVYINKGYNKFDEFYKALKDTDKKYNLKNEQVILHFRIGTSGNMNALACHPFPISDNVKELQAPRLNNLSAAVAHNGVIYNYAYKNDYNLSDTQNFIKDFMTPLKELKPTFYRSKKIQKLLQKECQSKLAIIDATNIVLIGDFEKADDGCYYSNGSYKKDYYKAAQQKYYSYNWSDYEAEKEKEATQKYDKFFDDANAYTYYMDGDELMLLNNNYYIQERKTDDLDEMYNADEWLAIDEAYNLYEIIDYLHDGNDIIYKVEMIEKDVTLFDNDLKEVQFKPNAKKWAVIDND